MKLFITGATGFVGSALRAHFRSRGHAVLGSSTRAPAEAGIVQHRLGEPVDPVWLSGVDVLIHAAWDLAPSAGERNLGGSRLWRDAAASSGARAVFISSYSAHEDFPTSYGRDKARAEVAFMGPGSAVVRPALVVGSGGLFAQLVQNVARSRILLLPDGGRHDVELVDVLDLNEAVERIATRADAGVHDLSAGRMPLREVCAGIARGLGHPPRRVVPIPVGPVLFALGLLARSGLELGLRERLLGYVENGKRQRSSSLADLLGRRPLDPHASVSSHAARITPD